MLGKKRKKAKEGEKPENPAFQTITIEVEKEQASMDPKQFMLWGFLGSLTLLFTGLVVAHIILSAQGDNYGHSLPWTFHLSTAIIAGSSYTLYKAQQWLREDDIDLLKTYLAYTFFLGIIFLLSQASGWYSMIGAMSDSGNSALVFTYILSGLHGFHILAGLIYLGITWYKAANFAIHSRNKQLLVNCSTFWHFLGGLWIYIFVIMVIF